MTTAKDTAVQAACTTIAVAHRSDSSMCNFFCFPSSITADALCDGSVWRWFPCAHSTHSPPSARPRPTALWTVGSSAKICNMCK